MKWHDVEKEHVDDDCKVVYVGSLMMMRRNRKKRRKDKDGMWKMMMYLMRN